MESRNVGVHISDAVSDRVYSSGYLGKSELVRTDKIW